MRRAILFVLVVSVATRQADGKVYYLENVDGPRNNDAAILEQSSRDLDLAFSAGEPLLENENVVTPTRKVYTVIAPEKPYIELSRETDRPIAYYRLGEPVAGRRNGYDDVIFLPERGRKSMKLNGNNKGEVILELRVIANHDST
ncbi:uncharacterized protein LOC105184257 [Harpegnathos saltator]|uniref:Uncharacterized protein n=1 Tax=Harpegnathos saltator TaxID=610380 RepID=E2BLS2_HARSA|nr:uncharacterized protein LOC105184257 [Harpegnathos saltator]EFN83406.1 hypothetical protein EAI_02224 [Harpegnathos saltator]